MNTKVIHECTTGALEGKTTFPQTVKKLVEIEVERYYADLIRMEKVFYAKNGETCIERLPIASCPPLADRFDEEGVKGSIRQIQQDQIGYAEFLRQIVGHGAASYTVYIDGRLAAYHGRRGECYIEKFPPQKS